jgi:hypothetical protein
LNLCRAGSDSDAGWIFLLELEPAMSKAARVTASVLPAVVSAEKPEATPLDPRILFSGICLLALVVGIVFGQPGIWS